MLDLKKPAGRDALLRLIETADVLVYNVRPQAMARLGLATRACRQSTRGWSMSACSASARTGPMPAKPAYDDLIQGATALPALIGADGDGEPRYVPMAMADRIVGLNGGRTRSGQRCCIATAPAAASASRCRCSKPWCGFVLGDHMGGLTYRSAARTRPAMRGMLSPDRRPYRTSDGYVCVLVYNDKQWQNFFDATGRDDLRSDPKFATFAGRAANIDTVYAELARILETRTTAEWTAILEKADVPVMPMHDLESLLADPHMVATDFFPVVVHPTEGRIRSMRPSARFSETPVETRRLAPRLSEHGAEILKEVGFSEAEIAAMIQGGVCKAAAGI